MLQPPEEHRTESVEGNPATSDKAAKDNVATSKYMSKA
jgi:hypothetical protein